MCNSFKKDIIVTMAAAAETCSKFSM